MKNNRLKLFICMILVVPSLCAMNAKETQMNKTGDIEQGFAPVIRENKKIQSSSSLQKIVNSDTDHVDNRDPKIPGMMKMRDGSNQPIPPFVPLKDGEWVYGSLYYNAKTGNCYRKSLCDKSECNKSDKNEGCIQS